MESGPIVYYSRGMSFYGERLERLYGCSKYNPQTDRHKPVFFSSLYFGDDYAVLQQHRGPVSIFWNGSDVIRLIRSPDWQVLLSAIKADHFCHNTQLQNELASVGISATIYPIFFGDVNGYKPSFKPSSTPHVFMVSHPGREIEYGVGIVQKIAPEVPDVIFHVFGDEGESRANIRFHGDVAEEIMDQLITEYQGCLRLNRHDGFSQTVIKSILLAQYPICYQDIPGTMRAQTDDQIIDCLNQLKTKTEPNLELRERYIRQFSKLPV